MPAGESRLTWTQTVPKPLDVYVANCGPHDFEIHAEHGLPAADVADPPRGFALRSWENDGYGLEDAKERAASHP
jgi:hypothetical protein